MKKVVNYTDGKKFKSKEEYLEHAKKEREMERSTNGVTESRLTTRNSNKR